MKLIACRGLLGPWRKSFAKTMLVMKMLTVIMLAFCLNVTAGGYAQKLSMSQQNVAAEKVFKEINKQTGFKFVYTEKLLKKIDKISVTAKDAPLEQVLKDMFKDKSLTYTIVDGYIVLKEKTRPADEKEYNAPPPPPPFPVSGKVSNDKGEPLDGASILEKGTNSNTTTKQDGKFSITVSKPTTTLVVSYVGYQVKEVPVNNQSDLVIVLTLAASSISDVVVMGYGTQKRRNVTGSVSSMNAKNLDERPVTRVDQALVGQLAGVQVKQTSGAPGKGFSVQVRGSGSISASNEPLYVIDGFPLETSGQNATGGFSTGNPLDNINPNDIENIQVLKDASAAAIYGSRAANGVVLVTTKKGRSGKPKLSFNTFGGITKATRHLDLLDAAEWVGRATEIIDGTWAASAPGRTASQSNEERRVILGLAPGNVNPNLMTDDRWFQEGYPGLTVIDWQNEAFRTGLIQNYQISGSGGNEFVKYYASLNYINQDGIVINTGYKSYSGRANIEITPNKKLKFGLNVAPTFSITTDPGVEGKDKGIHLIASMLPLQEDTMGLDANVGKNDAYRWSAARNSPIRMLQNSIGENRTNRTLATGYFDYEIIKGLNFKTTLNFDNTDAAIKNYIPDFVSGNVTARRNSPGTQATGSYNGFKKQTFVNENTLSYNKTINSVHDISLLAGQSYNATKLSYVRLTATGGFNSSFINTLNAAANITGTTNNYTTETKNVLLSYFGRIQYGFDGKYLLSASVRRDGSSRFGDNNKWGWFPSVSAGWRVIEERFMSNITAISDLKLRASWGKSGNYNIGDYSSIPTLGFYNASFGGSQVSGLGSNRLANADLTWEKSQTFDFGLDIGLFKNRLNASFDYYTRTNEDLLLNVPIPQATGFATALRNIGEVKNKGWEVEINSRNVTGRFQWSTSLNLSHNSNKVVHLGPGDAPILIPSLFDIQHSILQVGQAMNSYYLVQQTGILSAEDISKGVAIYGPEKEGDPKYLDANADGKIDANDRVLSGHPNPDYTWGITNTFKYKGFDLTVLVQGQNGGHIYSLFGRAVDRTGQSYNENSIGVQRDRWRSAADPGDGERSKAYSTFGRIKNTDWLWSSDYWRIRNITLGYDLGKAINKKQIQQARLYLSVENWFGKDKYKGGWNPEAVNTDLSGNTNFPQGGDYGGLPLPRSLILGLNLTF